MARPRTKGESSEALDKAPMQQCAFTSQCSESLKRANDGQHSPLSHLERLELYPLPATPVVAHALTCCTSGHEG